MPTCVTPAALSQSRSASSSRLTVRNVRTSLRARAPAAPISRQATTVSWCTSSPQHRSMIACILASLPQKAIVTPQVGSRHCHTCSPFPGATKNSTSMQRGPDCLSGSEATQNVSASTRSPIENSDKPARAAIIFNHNGARPAQLGCLAPPEKVAFYAGQLAPLLAQAPAGSWLLLHHPVWAMWQGTLPPLFAGLSTHQTLQAAIRGLVPPSLDLVLSGHVHDFLSYDFGPKRPVQLIVGTGGDKLQDLGSAPITGTELDGVTVRDGIALARYGYLVLDRNPVGGWDGVLYAPDDTVLARCRLSGRSVNCR